MWVWSNGRGHKYECHEFFWIRPWKYGLNVDAELIPLFVLFISAMKAAKDVRKERKNFHLAIKLHLYKSNGNFNRSVDLACTCMLNKALEKHQVNYKVTRFFTRNLAQGLALKVALSLAIS